MRIHASTSSPHAWTAWSNTVYMTYVYLLNGTCKIILFLPMHGEYSQSSFARLVHESDNCLSVASKRELIDVFVEVDQTDAFTGL